MNVLSPLRARVCGRYEIKAERSPLSLARAFFLSLSLSSPLGWAWLLPEAAWTNEFMLSEREARAWWVFLPSRAKEGGICLTGESRDSREV